MTGHGTLRCRQGTGQPIFAIDWHLIGVADPVHPEVRISCCPRAREEKRERCRFARMKGMMNIGFVGVGIWAEYGAP